MRPENPFHPSSRRTRALQATVAIFLVLGALSSAFFRTQVVRGDEFTLRADGNRFRVVPIPAPRGTIYDRQHRVVAETVTGYTLSLEPGPPDSVRKHLAPVAEVLGLDSAEVEDIVAHARKSRVEPITVSDALTFRQVSRLAERQGKLPGVIMEAHPIRHYPFGEAMGHVIGYVAEISEQELANKQWAGYRSGQIVGKTGVERTYDKALGGTPGARYVEVDARGKVVGRFAQQVYESPRAGQDVQLTIDLDLQRYAHQIFPADKRGAIVAMVPGTGEILAMYSQPTYDPNLLIGRIRPDVWRALNDPSRPMLNRATLATYPPGSTWKLATAMVALEHHVIGPRDRMPIPCTGGMTFAGRYARCAKKDGHGFLDLGEAIAASCNVYFYQLGIRLGLDMLASEGTRMGFGRRTGVDLPAERPGTFPASREWYREKTGHRPPPSEVMNVAIGQGPNDQTPVRMAQFYSAMASPDGVARAPHVVRTARPAPVETDLHVSHQTLMTVRDAMARVVEEGGTAAAVALERWTLYGKTGTAQNSQDPAHNHAWFVGFAGPPGKDPEIVVATIVEFGGHGGETAAPLAARVADYYLNKLHGIKANPALTDSTP